MIKDIQELNFPSYATLSSATVTLNDMGDRTISAQVKIDGDIVPDFSYDWEVEFKGERYIQPLRQPQASKGNESMRSTIDLVFYHKTICQLKRYYFVEMTSTESGTAIADQYIASLGLNLSDFCVAFQKVLDHYFDGEISIDLNPNLDYTKGVQFMSISYSYIWDVLQKMYEVYGVRWHIEGNAIKVGYPSPILSHTFQYGYEGGLLQVERQVQDANIRNSLLGRGGEQNLPAYYFKEAPEGSLFASDPDAIPELANIYFSNLRGKTFRDYVKGWKAKHYDGAPMSEPTEAYTKGYTDIKFNPIEYVEDKESIEKYGLLQGALDNNEEIYPSIQNAPNGEDVVVYVEPVTTDEVVESVRKESVITNIEPSYITISMPQNSTSGRHKLSVDFEVPEGKVGYLSYNIVLLDAINKGNDITDNIIFLRKEFTVQNLDTNENVDSTYYPTGKYRYTIDFTLKSESNYAGTIKATVGIEQAYIESFDSIEQNDKWLPTFNIWVKNIWNSTRKSGESDLEYAERVWRPILGDRQGNEAKVAFSSGWLSGHEDYEFTIVDFAYDNSHEYNGTQSEWKLTLNKSDAELEATGKYIPSASTNGQAYAGDTFFFIGIDMPHQYVLWAEERLDNYKTSSLNEVSEIQPKWVVRLDKLRLHEEEDNLAEQIVVGGAINLADVRFIDAPALQLYLQSVTYTWNEQTLLYPDIEVVLADTIVPVQNPVAQLQGSIDAINSQLYNIGNVAQTVRKIGDSLYLRKDGVADISKSPTKFVGNVSGNNFRQGKVGGADWGIYRDENGNAIAEFDKIIARKDLEVNNLVINQVSYVGGMQITSAASLEITRVIENDNAYQCFFDQKGGSVANLFQVNDIAYSQRFDEENNTTKYYKRVVVAVDIDSITLSKSQVDGEGVPMANDAVIHYGNTTDTNRQYVIIRDVIGGGYERMLSDLNSVSAEGVEYYFAGRPNGSTPRWFVGNKEQQFIEYKDGHLQINADVTLGSGSDLSASEDFKQVQQDANDAKDTAQNAKNTAQSAQSYIDNILPKDLASLQSQIDGAIDSYFQEYDPTLSNYPANEWDTTEEKESHLNDTFTNNLTGASWRWSKNGDVYSWVEIQDTATVKALALAGQAKETADGKNRTFISQPYTPYYEGDLWTQGDEGRLMRCVASRLTGEFSNEDWQVADDSHEYTERQAQKAENNAKEYTNQQIATVDYLKQAFPHGSILDVNGVTLSALVGVKDENNAVVAGLYGGGSVDLNKEGYEDDDYGAMLLFGGIESADKPTTYKTAIFENGYIISKRFQTGKDGKRVEIFDNELLVYGDDENKSVLSISYDSNGKPRLQYSDKNGNVSWYLTDDGLDNTYSIEETDNNFISKVNPQNIDVVHNFLQGFTIAGIPFRKMANGSLFIDANVVFGGGATMYGTDTTPAPSIFDGLPIDGRTIKRDGNGALYVDETALSISGGGGVADSVAWANVTGKPKWLQDAGNTKPTYNYSEIQGTPDLSVYFLASNFTKANIKSTLGISDWALASAAPTIKKERLTNFDSATPWTAFYTSFQASNRPDGANYFSGFTLSNIDFQGEDNTYLIQLALSYNGTLHTRYRSGGSFKEWKQIAFTSDIPSLNGYATQSWVNTALAGYLPLSGGTINGSITATSFIGNLTGNADSATKLATPRTIWGQYFDGTGNVSGRLEDVEFVDFDDWLQMGIIRNDDSSVKSVNIQSAGRPLLINPLGNNVAIGGTTASEKLHVHGNLLTTGKLRILLNNTNPSSSVVANAILNYNISPYGLITRLYSSGNVGLQAQREASDAECFNLLLNHLGGNVAIGGTTANAKLHVHGNLLTEGGITMYSQRSLKNILSYEGLSLEQLSVIKPIRFTWKNGRDNRYHVGGVADDVETVVPEVVYSANDFLTMDYGNAGFYVAASLIKPVIYCYNKVEDHEKDIDYLKRENVAIKNENKALRDEINQLKQAS